jgi:3-methyladenine DNA glycosylase/8-oxoguanine DNA glycosylase
MGARTTNSTTIELQYEPPFRWRAILDFLAARAIPGVEEVVGERYARTFAIDGHVGIVTVAAKDGRHALLATVDGADRDVTPEIVRRLRRVFDLEADVSVIEAHLRRSSLLEPLIAAQEGLRTPGAWDGFELGVRAMLGQQITVVAARALAGKVAATFGARLDKANGSEALTTVFPGPEALVGADLAALGMPGARARAISHLAAAALADRGLFEGRGTLAESVERLRTLPGIGEWTAQYICLRALKDPDAFPAADVGLVTAASGTVAPRLTPKRLLEMAEPWRPWRSYAAQHLWTSAYRSGQWSGRP